MSWYSDGEGDLYDRDPDFCEGCERGFTKEECDRCAARHYEKECRWDGQRCETCEYFTWDFIKEIFYCANEKSDWLNEELEAEGWCDKWVEQ